MTTDVDMSGEPDFNPSPNVKFHRDPLTGGIIAQLGRSVFALTWYPGGDGGGYVRIGRPFMAGAQMTAVTNPKFEYAENAAAFRRIANGLNNESQGKTS